jgi:hypothetical protein
MLLGFVLVLLVTAAAVFGIYCYFNPEARNESVAIVDVQWQKVKNSGDELIDKARTAEPAVSSKSISVSAGESTKNPLVEPYVGQ